MALDITTDDGSLAFLADGQSIDDAVWTAAQWTRTAPSNRAEPLDHSAREYRFVPITAEVDGDNDMAWLRILIGPDGDITLPAGTYAVKAKITDSPEMPILSAGWLTVL